SDMGLTRNIGEREITKQEQAEESGEEFHIVYIS
ncbi:uncharacterized protein METZ01_LOCUS298703, partial [marine metagenome]